MANTLNVTDLAARLETDARTTRKFLRSITPADEQPGKGSRWEVPAKQVQSLKSKFKKYQTDIQASKTSDITDENIALDDTLPAEVIDEV